MEYTPELLEQYLGEDYDPEATYLIETHAGSASRVIQGTHKIVGRVPDFSLNEEGTMMVLECLAPNPTDPSGGSGVSSKTPPQIKPHGHRARATAIPQTLQPPPPSVAVEEPVVETDLPPAPDGGGVDNPDLEDPIETEALDSEDTAAEVPVEDEGQTMEPQPETTTPQPSVYVGGTPK